VKRIIRNQSTFGKGVDINFVASVFYGPWCITDFYTVNKFIG